jgi:hypothetical protein
VNHLRFVTNCHDPTIANGRHTARTPSVTTISVSWLRSWQFDCVTRTANFELGAFVAASQSDSGEIPMPVQVCYCNGIFS